jgi:hypothetical protein
MKDAASVKKRLEQLSQQDNPHSLRAISEGGVNESTECLFKSKDSDTAAVKTRLNS